MKKQEVKKVSDLARIELSDLEETIIGNEFKKIVDYMNKIQEVSAFIDASEDTYVNKQRNITDEDVVENDFSIEKVTKLFPEIEESCLKVKKVIIR